jgi:parallel beta-helix repeat protein
LSIDRETSTLYCFWFDSPTTGHIYYKKRVQGVWDSSYTDWVTDSSIVAVYNNYAVSSSYECGNFNDEFICVIYETGTSSPYNVKIMTLACPRTIYINPDGSITPSTANITTSDKVTYTFTSNNYLPIVVQKSGITIDGGGYTVQGTGAMGSIGMNLSGITTVTVKNVKIKAFFVGVVLIHSSSCSFSGNNITANNYGIELDYSSGNKFYHNNFIDNAVQVYIYSSGYANMWDNGYPSGGNYWSDYTGTDADGDGIGDTPYTIDANNKDNYPLMYPYIAGDCNHDGIVNINDATLIGWYWQQTVPPAPTNVDINEDGIINILDATIVGLNWLKHA